jgi:hypothetical protein
MTAPDADPDDRREAYRKTQQAADMLDSAAQDLGYRDVGDIDAADDELHHDDGVALDAIRLAHSHLRSGDCHGLIDRFEGEDRDE